MSLLLISHWIEIEPNISCFLCHAVSSVLDYIFSHHKPEFKLFYVAFFTKNERREKRDTDRGEKRKERRDRERKVDS